MYLAEVMFFTCAGELLLFWVPLLAHVVQTQNHSVLSLFRSGCVLGIRHRLPEANRCERTYG